MEIRICTHPDFAVTQELLKMVGQLGFVFDDNMIRDQHPEGAYIEYSPIPAPPDAS